MKSYDLPVLVVFIPEGRPQQRILLLGGRLAKLASDLVHVFASLDGGRRLIRKFGSRQNRPPAGRVTAAPAAGRPAGGHIAAAIGATAQDGPVATGRTTAEALIRRRAYAASGDGLLLGAHDFIEVFQGFVEDALCFGHTARRTAAACAAAGPSALLASIARGIAAGSAVAGFLATGLTGVTALTAALLAAVAALTARLGAILLSSTFLTLAVSSLTARLTRIATLTVTASVLTTGLTRIAALAVTGSVLTSRLTRIAALTVTGSVLTLGIALGIARLTRGAVTLTTRLRPLWTARGEWRPTAR